MFIEATALALNVCPAVTIQLNEFIQFLTMSSQVMHASDTLVIGWKTKSVSKAPLNTWIEPINRILRSSILY